MHLSRECFSIDKPLPRLVQSVFKFHVQSRRKVARTRIWLSDSPRADGSYRNTITMSARQRLMDKVPQKCRLWAHYTRWPHISAVFRPNTDRNSASAVGPKLPLMREQDRIRHNLESRVSSASQPSHRRQFNVSFDRA